jgi:hypothetical protein
MMVERKMNMLGDMLTTVRRRGIAPSLVVMDSFYASVANLYLLHDWGWTFVAGVKSNRIVFSLKERKATKYHINTIAISDEDRLVHPSWIQYYDSIPKEVGNKFRFTETGIDLTILQRESADYTAMITEKVYDYRENLRIYILPNPINKKMGFPQTVETAAGIATNLKSKLYIEDVSYQQARIQHLSNVMNIPAEGVKVSGQDKPISPDAHYPLNPIR